jgi:uncharacterized protein (TIGR02996 family)
VSKPRISPATARPVTTIRNYRYQGFGSLGAFTGVFDRAEVGFEIDWTKLMPLEEMSAETVLVRKALDEDPDNDTLRLAYSDKLEEDGLTFEAARERTEAFVRRCVRRMYLSLAIPAELFRGEVIK